jgi:hypothetical protein
MMGKHLFLLIHKGPHPIKIIDYDKYSPERSDIL